jgi:DNA-binding MarR family transcriptional regulator
MIASRYQTLFGISIPEWRVIAVIAEHGKMSQQLVCQITRMDKVTVSRAAIGLVGRKLIVRTLNPDDKRSQLLALSASGRQLYDSIAPRAMAMETQIFSCLSKNDRLTLVQLLGRIDAHIDTLGSLGQ